MSTPVSLLCFASGPLHILLCLNTPYQSPLWLAKAAWSSGLSLDTASSRKPSLPSSRAQKGHCAARPCHSTDPDQHVSPLKCKHHEARDWVWPLPCLHTWPSTWHNTNLSAERPGQWRRCTRQPLHAKVPGTWMEPLHQHPPRLSTQDPTSPIRRK